MLTEAGEEEKDRRKRRELSKRWTGWRERYAERGQEGQVDSSWKGKSGQQHERVRLEGGRMKEDKR
jgi:hypothetical protein